MREGEVVVSKKEKATEYISKQEAVEALRACGERSAFPVHRKAMNGAAEIVGKLPAAEVAEVVHAHWLTWEEQFPGAKVPRNNHLGVFCSNPECNKHADNMFDFCPNCGADMREDGYV